MKFDTAVLYKRLGYREFNENRFGENRTLPKGIN